MTQQPKQRGPLSTLALGTGAAILVIPFLPIILPIVLLFYTGEIVKILLRGGKR